MSFCVRPLACVGLRVCPACRSSLGDARAAGRWVSARPRIEDEMGGSRARQGPCRYAVASRRVSGEGLATQRLTRPRRASNARPKNSGPSSPSAIVTSWPFGVSGGVDGARSGLMQLSSANSSERP